MIYILSILFTITFVIYQKWQFSDDNNKSKGKWHLWGALLRLQYFIPFLFPYDIKDVILAGSINIILFDLLLNKIALNKQLLYIGFTSYINNKLGKYKWFVYFGQLVLALIIKFL